MARKRIESIIPIESPEEPRIICPPVECTEPCKVEPKHDCENHCSAIAFIAFLAGLLFVAGYVSLSDKLETNRNSIMAIQRNVAGIAKVLDIPIK